jgi:Protein of unknown function (DUF2726)
MEWLILLIVAAVFIALVCVKRPRRPTNTSGLFPYQRNQVLLSVAERSFLGVLDQAIGKDFRVFAQVRIADVVATRGTMPRVEWWKAFNKISAKHVDFRLCERNDLSIVCVIELDDRLPMQLDRQIRHEFLRSVRHAASLPLLQFPAKATYAVADVQARIVQAIGTRGRMSRDNQEQHAVATNAAEFGEPPKCPAGASARVLRTARSGPHSGNQVRGCIRYPTCRGTRAIDV